MKLTQTIALLTLALPFTGFAKEKPLTLDQIPAKAAAAIRASSGNAPVKITPENEEGVKGYEAQWTADGHKHEMVVTDDGTVLIQEESIAQEAAPAPVQAAIKALNNPGKFRELNKITEKGVTLYEVAFDTKEGELEIKFDANGKEVSREVEKKGDKKDDDKEDEGEL